MDKHLEVKCDIDLHLMVIKSTSIYREMTKKTIFKITGNFNCALLTAYLLFAIRVCFRKLEKITDVTVKKISPIFKQSFADF